MHQLAFLEAVHVAGARRLVGPIDCTYGVDLVHFAGRRAAKNELPDG